MIISVQNQLASLPGIQYSFLSSNITSGGTTLPLKNINSFTDGWAVQIGKTGEAQSEIALISGAPSGGSANLSGTLRFDHSIDTPIYQIHYDSIIFERSTAGTAGTAIAIGTQLITPNSLYTEFNDATGTTTYAYKTKFYNSGLTDVSSESDWFIPAGPSFYSLQAVRQRGKDALYNANYLKSDSIIGDWINEWIELMNNEAIKVDQGYSMGTVDVAFGTAGFGTVTDATFKQINKLQVTYDGNTFSNSTEIPYNRFAFGDNFNTLYPRHSWLGDSVFQINPPNAGGTARIAFSQLATPLVNDSDSLPVVLRAYTTGCIEYILYRAYDNDLKPEDADRHYGRFLKGQQDFIQQITPRDQTGVKSIDFVESLSGGQDSIELISDFII